MRTWNQGGEREGEGGRVIIPKFLRLPPTESGLTHCSSTSYAAWATRYHDAVSETAMPDRELTLMAHDPSAKHVSQSLPHQHLSCACDGKRDRYESRLAGIALTTVDPPRQIYGPSTLCARAPCHLGYQVRDLVVGVVAADVVQIGSVLTRVAL